MIPVVALVGCPNVGKLTLFNRLTRTRGALVADLPGLTRDRKYGWVEVEGRKLICIGTGGIDGTEEGVKTRVAKQSLLATEEADVVLFMVDVRTSLMPADIIIAKHLRSHGKLIFSMANKAGGIDVDQAMVDFRFLDLGDIYPIAAPHGHGVTSLLEQALLLWVGEISPQKEVDEDAEYWTEFGAEQNGGAEEEPEDDFNLQDLPIKLAIVGRPNIGKSTLTNRTLGEDRVVIYDIPGTTRDSIYIPMQCDEREHVLIDTAGVRKCGRIIDVVEKFLVIKTLQTIEDANIALLAIDAREGIFDQDLSLLGFILNSGRPLVIVVNKRDSLSQRAKEQVKEALGYRLDFIDFARVYFISALHGSGVGNLFESAREAYDSVIRRVSTAVLIRIMNMAAEDHQPSLVRDCRVKLKYAHVGGYNPPIMVIHGNQAKDPLDPYKHYLMNYSRKSLDVMGTLIRTQSKEGENPLANKRSTLTPNQMRKRKCLIKHIKKSK